ncbi:MAG: phosphotransferase [Candidatus Zixiibacteriota bacterium]|nr:MAG: phosphotransferase [candidate division Zixibacteria bacterium]
MLKHTEDVFTTNSTRVLGRASELYDFRPEDLNKLGSFESFVFEFAQNGQPHILKVIPGSHRLPPRIHGELEWINYLVEGGVSAARPVRSNTGSLVELVEPASQNDPDSEPYSLVVFEKAMGRTATEEDWSEKLFTEWGRTMGRMHALTKDYRPSHPSLTRHQWYEDEDLNPEKYLPPSEHLVREKCAALIERIRSLPTDRDSFGLVHEDMHHGNFFVDNGKITVFDFDDCQYHWFAADISIPLFYVMRNKRLNQGTPQFARHFFSHFLEGYNRENSLEREWLTQIPLFHKLREMMLYIIIHAEQAFELNDWCRDFFKDRKHRIENDIPVIDIDFSEFR